MVEGCELTKPLLCLSAMEWLPVIPVSTVHTSGNADHTSFHVDGRSAFDALLHRSVVSCQPIHPLYTTLILIFRDLFHGRLSAFACFSGWFSKWLIFPAFPWEDRCRVCLIN